MASSYKQKHVPIEPKGLYYHGDGTGRDGYVLKFNGGLFSQAMLENLKPRAQNSYTKMHFDTKIGKRRNPPAFENKVSHYPPDGSGRDTYISINEGGRAVNYNIKSKHDQLFNTHLRSYEKMPTVHDRSSGLIMLTDYGYRTPKQIEDTRTTFYKQREQSARLSQNKRILKPPQRNFTPVSGTRSLKFFKTKILTNNYADNSYNKQMSQSTQNFRSLKKQQQDRGDGQLTGRHSKRLSQNFINTDIYQDRDQRQILNGRQKKRNSVQKAFNSNNQQKDILAAKKSMPSPTLN